MRAPSQKKLIPVISEEIKRNEKEMKRNENKMKRNEKAMKRK